MPLSCSLLLGSNTIIHNNALFELPSEQPTRREYQWTLDPARDFSGVLAPQTPTAIPCWSSKQQCLVAINVALLSPEGVALRRRYEVSLSVCLGVARTDADTADSATGRNVQTSHQTGARNMGRTLGVVRSARTYRKVRDILRILGLQVVTDEGRYLTKTERLQASLFKDPNSRRPAQIRKASTRLFTMSRFVRYSIGHLPRRGSTVDKPDLKSTNQKRANARRPGKQGVIWGLPLQRLAGKLVNEVTFLRSVHPRAICGALDAAGIDPEWWTPYDVATAMYATVTEQRWTAPAAMTNPMGYLKFLLGTITPEGVTAHVGRKRKAWADRETRLASARAATRRALGLMSPTEI